MLYYFKRDASSEQRCGAQTRGIASQRLTAQSQLNQLRQWRACAAWHASWLLMHDMMRCRFRCRCSAVLPCYRTHELLSLKQVPTTISTTDTLSPHLTGGFQKLSIGARRPARDQMMAVQNEGVPVHRSLLGSYQRLGMPETRMRPRRDRLYRPPTAAPLCFESQARWALSATVVAEE